jgi:phosphoribosylanthranilate isomerase
LTSLQQVAGIVAQLRRCGTNTIQLCDRLPPGTLPQLRAALPGVSLVQVVHVTGEEALADALEVAPLVDAVLLDSGDPTAPVKRLGGTGRTHDWTISARIRQAVSVPVYLAGGLKADNVGAAIRAVRPFAVDVCSGVRTGDRLDAEKLAAFVSSVQAVGRGCDRTT